MAVALALGATLFAPSPANADWWHGRGWWGPRFGFYLGGYPYPYYAPVYAYPPYYFRPYVRVVSPAPAVTPAPALQPQTFRVFFDFNRAALTPDAIRVVDQAVAEAKRAGAARIEVTGYTDTVGSKGYNLALSEQRARRVRDYMVAHGVAAEQIAFNGLGKDHPLVATGDQVREKENRRVEIVISSPGPVAAARGRQVYPVAGRGATVTPVE